jgi:hypothetical protein
MMLMHRSSLEIGWNIMNIDIKYSSNNLRFDTNS